MPPGEYTLPNIPAGTYNVTASKPGHTNQVYENIKVLEGQTTILNIQLGGDSMEHIIDVSITNCDEETIVLPDGCTTKSYKFLGAISNNPMVGITFELLTPDDTTVLQTQTTDANGLVTFTEVIYGNYKLRKV